MTNEVVIGECRISDESPAFIVAELSGNHNQDFERAVELIKAAKKAGADAIKLQTYTADTLTIDSNQEFFRLSGTAWAGKTLYEIYQEAYTPWEWQPRLKQVAEDLGMPLFSSAFDGSSVDFLEAMQVPAYKVASSEITDIPLLRRIASTGKPVIISTGMASIAEIDDAVAVFRSAGVEEIVLLKCTAAYPAKLADMNLNTIPHLAKTFGVIAGLSDHSFGTEAAVVSVSLGGRFIEKHLTLRRSDGGPDSTFSLEPEEFSEMVNAVRNAEQALGTVSYGATLSEKIAKECRRSLFVVTDIEEGEFITEYNVRSIRPGNGLPPKFLDEVIGRTARTRLSKGTPLQWSQIE